ncbi:MAG TPA: hypothetical protein VKB22_05590, partial [Gemmatimonadales bacterium]|nr:hypothetical protein [Gemmatimonadales bacterium]
MTAPATQQELYHLVQPLRSRSWLAWIALGLGTAALLLGGSAWLVRLGWLTVPYWVLAAWGLALLGLAAIACLAWRNQRQLTPPSLARSLEDLGAWRRGSLTALLDSSASGTSHALFQLADRTQADEIRARGQAALEPIARPVQALLLGSWVFLLIGILAFTSAGPVKGVAAALWFPGRAWEATVAPVRLRAERSTVDRG